MTCHCMGPQNGQPLCPCAMAAARNYQTNWGVAGPQYTLYPDAPSEPVAYRWKWDKHLEWHYGEYLSQRDYYAVEPLYNVNAAAQVPARAEALKPIYFVRHPDGSYSAADPQP